MRWPTLLTLSLTSIAHAQTQDVEPPAPTEPVACMSIDVDGMETLYATMHEVVLSIQVCASENNYTDAAELYFIAWPFLMFNQEATKDDLVTHAYVNALDASLQHYVTTMDERHQDTLFDHLDQIVDDPDNRARMCSHLKGSTAPLVDIRQGDQSAALPEEDAADLWISTVTRFGCQ